MHTSVRTTNRADAMRDGGRLAERFPDDARTHAADIGSPSAAMRALVVDVVERSSTWRERLSSEFVAAPDSSSAGHSPLLELWCANASRGDPDDFARRLALDGLDRDGAARALGRVRRRPGLALPEWARLLETWLRSLPDAVLRSDAADASVPFRDVLAPLADIAVREMEERAGSALACTSGDARLALRAALMWRLASIGAPPLYERFDRLRSQRSTCAGRSPDSPPEGEARSGVLHDEFVRDMLHGGMHTLVAELPVMARALGTTALHWRDTCIELLGRLESDRAAIADHFFGGRDPGDLVGVHAGRSDPHSGGRTVHILRFASGSRLVYKPRSLGVDAAFAVFLDWLAIRGAPVPGERQNTFMARTLDRSTHGWAEYVVRSDCHDSHAVRRYHQNAGSLLALLHALGSSDFHYENIIAAGDRPVMVDLETILQAELARAEPPVDCARNRGARLLLDESILRTGMLPIWQHGGVDGAFDLGGLTAAPGQKTSSTSMRWSSVNSDAVRIHREPAATDAKSNMPRLDGRVITPAECAGDLQRGFIRMYEWLIAHRDELLQPAGPVDRLARERVRFIVRPSGVYDFVLRRSLRGSALHDGAVRGIELELLARALEQLPSELHPILEEEERALRELDIPLFTIPGDSTTLRAGRHLIHLTRSALDVARARLQSLGSADLELQLRVLRSSLELRYTAPADAAASAPSVTPLPRSALIACAARLARAIRETALTDCAGYRTWIVTEPVSRAGHRRLHTTGYGVYDGTAGIALFLAAFARCTGDDEAASLAVDALVPLRSRLRVTPSYADEYGLGGAEGTASAIYALTRAGVLLGDNSMLDDALRAARLITPAIVARDTAFDVLYGSAGAILALLALFEVRRSDWLVERAIGCGRHLLSSRRALSAARDTTPRAWPAAGGPHPVGMAHGATGIALALFRLHAVTGMAEYASAAIDAVEADEMLRHITSRELRSGAAAAARSRQRRPSPMIHEGPPLATSWCRGSSGIGLVCLTPTGGAHSLALRAIAQRCVSHVRLCDAPSGRADDTACCGTMGEVELLLTAGLRWGDDTLLACAHERASRVVRRLRSVERGATSRPESIHFIDPALYRGAAGIGYSLLRLCCPEILPSLLSWE